MTSALICDFRLHLFLVVSRDSLVRSFLRLRNISWPFSPSFLPRILICRRPSCSAATKERERETETSVPFFLLSSDKKPQDRPHPAKSFLYKYHVSIKSCPMKTFNYCHVDLGKIDKI